MQFTVLSFFRQHCHHCVNSTPTAHRQSFKALGIHLCMLSKRKVNADIANCFSHISTSRNWSNATNKSQCPMCSRREHSKCQREIYRQRLSNEIVHSHHACTMVIARCSAAATATHQVIVLSMDQFEYHQIIPALSTTFL